MTISLTIILVEATGSEGKEEEEEVLLNKTKTYKRNNNKPFSHII